MHLLKQVLKTGHILKNNGQIHLVKCLRECSDLSIVRTELDVPTFCDIYVDLACKVRIKPLDVHKYHNLNALLLQTDQKYDDAIEHYVDGNKVVVTGQEGLHRTTLCSIKAPVKANLHVKAKNDVSIGFFHGDKLNVHTEGNVYIDRFQGETLNVTTSNGNIFLKNFIQAANIAAKVTNGNITTGRLQGVNLKLKVLGNGNLTIDSSYCKESVLVVEKGNMDLQNLHKDCKIFLMKGNLSMAGFDGQLSAVLTSGSADIHLARISGNSDITLKDVGRLNLKLAETCQEITTFKVTSPDVKISDNIKSKVDAKENLVIMGPEGPSGNVVLVNCSNASVKVESLSWQEMIKQKIKTE